MCWCVPNRFVSVSTPARMVSGPACARFVKARCGCHWAGGKIAMINVHRQTTRWSSPPFTKCQIEQLLGPCLNGARQSAVCVKATQWACREGPDLGCSHDSAARRRPETNFEGIKRRLPTFPWSPLRRLVPIKVQRSMCAGDAHGRRPIHPIK